MIYVHEWGKVPVGSPNGLTRAQANDLLAAARAHSLGGEDGTSILTDHHTYLRAKQVVGVLAAKGCCLEILPKVDIDSPDEDVATVRSRLLQMLDVAFDLKLSNGEAAILARQNNTLLDIFIRLFADRLLAQTRRGLPRLYIAQDGMLPALRGRLDVRKQFTINAIRPDRLACRYDDMSSDIPLLQIMKTCVVILTGFARSSETQRRLSELRFALADVGDLPRSELPWTKVHLDRTNQRWHVLLHLARLFLGRDWQATHTSAQQPQGISLLFSMNDLFEAYVGRFVRKALEPRGFEVIIQGGLKYCLGPWVSGQACYGTLFQTRPDILIRRSGVIEGVIDTKWKKIGTSLDDRKHGVSQADLYQMMAYAQIYECGRVMLLYPHHGGLGDAALNFAYGISNPRLSQSDRLDVVTVDIAQEAPAFSSAVGRLTSKWLHMNACD